MKEQLLRLSRYNQWANERILETVNRMDTSLRDKEVVSSFPSIQKTLFHILDAELVWMGRLEGKAPSWPPTASIADPTIDLLKNSGGAFVAHIESRDENYFLSMCSFRNSKGIDFNMRRDGILMHVFNHSTFHRGQVITMFRQLGLTEIPSTDLITFLRD